VGKGFRAIIGGLNAERVISASAALGIGEAALRRGVQYAEERDVFDRPIGQTQGISFQLAEAKVRIEAAQAVLDMATWLVDEGQPAVVEANCAKWLCAEAGFYAADVALQVDGGFGHGKEFHVERYFREASSDAHRTHQPGNGAQLRRRACAWPAPKLLSRR
jgi:acyl-CoA dehydrogenase